MIESMDDNSELQFVSQRQDGDGWLMDYTIRVEEEKKA